ncbi:Rho GTPase activating protein [Mucor velutinosus]|uniref:Rho GTPase activating protein n=1 Tax=Mucor velutinosus TaxID=708070 RepID=A0AAN7D483_9FUNG|nr:Rho GTPase activating protein [Mucor velutinosus]
MLPKQSKKVQEEEEDAVYEVEEIVGHRRSAKNQSMVEYLIKWKDYAPEYNTWEKERNVYSKGLISNYWSTQPYTLTAFKKKLHETDSTIPKKRPAAPPATKVDRKKVAQEIRSSQISTAPPSGLVWSDVEAIVNVFHSEPATFFAEVKWKNGQRNTYIPTRIIKKYCPQQLIAFYESQIEFYLPP